jgi:hypothetical protein
MGKVPSLSSHDRACITSNRGRQHVAVVRVRELQALDQVVEGGSQAIRNCLLHGLSNCGDSRLHAKRVAQQAACPLLADVNECRVSRRIVEKQLLLVRSHAFLLFVNGNHNGAVRFAASAHSGSICLQCKVSLTGSCSNMKPHSATRCLMR